MSIIRACTADRMRVGTPVPVLVVGSSGAQCRLMVCTVPTRTGQVAAFSTIGAGREYLHCGTQSKPEASAEACSPRRCRCRFVLMVAGKGLACGLSQAFPSLFASRFSSRRSLWRLCLSLASSSGTCTGTGTGSAAPKYGAQPYGQHEGKQRHPPSALGNARAYP